MSGSSGCGDYCFLRRDLPEDLFGVFDTASAERARRIRFLLQRSDPEFLEVLGTVFAPAPPVAVSPLRRSRRVLGLAAEFDDVAPPARRQRVSQVACCCT